MSDAAVRELPLPEQARGRDAPGRPPRPSIATKRASVAPPERDADLASMHPHGDPVQLTTQLMSIDSTSGREGDVVAWLDRYLADRGWRTRRIPVSAGRDDLFATMSDAPLVTLSTHLDTVPPFIAPRVENGRVLGRGACDAKGIAASMVCAADRLRDAGLPIALLFVVG